MDTTRESYLLLTTDFRPRAGGVAEYLHGIFASIAETCPVHVIVLGDAPQEMGQASYSVSYLSPSLPVTGLSVYRAFWVARKIEGARFMVRNARFLKSIARRASDQRRPPVVLIGVWDERSHHWCSALRTSGVPYVLFTYGLEAVRPVSRLWRVRRWRDFRGASRIIACSGPTASLVAGKFGIRGEIVVAHPGVSSEVLEPDAEIDCNLRRHLGLDSDAVLLGTVCRLVERKGIQYVIRALGSLQHEFRNVHFVVAGDGPYAETLQGITDACGVSKIVHYLGQISESRKRALYEAIDIFVMPNVNLSGADWEGFGIAFLEAALASKPSVAGVSGGVSDAVVHGVTGLQVDPESSNELASALRALITRPIERETMGAKARSRALEFSWANSASHVKRALAPFFQCGD